MPSLWRIRDRRTFAALRQHGHRGRSGPLSVTWLADPSPTPRVAYAVGRSVGPAVRRNRLRRRLRAAMTALAPELRPGAYLVGAGSDAQALGPDELRTRLAAAVRAAQLPAHPPATPS